MNQKIFFNSVTNGKKDIIQQVLDSINRLHIDYCVIGGLAVNAYVEPVVSLDLDIVIVINDINKFLKDAKNKFKIETFEHSINLSSKESDIRIQLQRDGRYQKFVPRASIKTVMGYQMKVASLEDVLQGKILAYSDKNRRESKRLKDLSDIARIIETYPKLKTELPGSILNIIIKEQQNGDREDSNYV